ncbi:MAG: MarR family transcriptional regulator [Verrucomicrobia bacterium]|nr:MarR family transcriptional regulator [Verrucomicrobiota bacterium]
MSLTTSKEHRRNTGVSQNYSPFTCNDCGGGVHPPEQTRLAELILKAADVWDRENNTCHLDAVSNATASSTDLTDNQVIILKTLAQLGASKPSTISQACQLSQPTVQRQLKNLLLANLIEKRGRTRGVRYALPKTEKNG